MVLLKYNRNDVEHRFTWENLTGLEPVYLTIDQAKYFDDVFKGRFPTKYEYSVWINNIHSNRVSDYLMDAYKKLKEDYPYDVSSHIEMVNNINNYRKNNGLSKIYDNHKIRVVNFQSSN